MSEMNRREFVQLTIAAAAVAGICGVCGEHDACAAEQLPGGAPGTGVPGSGPPGQSPNIVDAGPVSDYSKDGVFDKFARTDKVLIIRQGDKIEALSAMCTHKSTTVRLANGTLTCPAHGSRFDNEGKPTKGPAKVPLFRHAISINDQKHLIVDKSKKFGQNEWGDPKASVSVS